jgi:hypothetical protein
MKTALPFIDVSAKPTPTGNPIRDFESAIESEHGKLLIGTLYNLGFCFVRFYIHANRLGMDHFKPVKFSAYDLYSVTRIQPNLKRVNRGLTTLGSQYA